MWRTRGKIYKTRNPNLIITQVCNFPNINDTLEKNIKHYNLEKIQKDDTYRDIIAHCELAYGGCDFIVYALQDTVPKLANLKPHGKGWFWCIGYVSPTLQNAANALNKPSKRINQPNFNGLYEWLKYYKDNHGDSYHYIYGQKLFLDALHLYIYDNKPEQVDSHRIFNLIQRSNFVKNFETLTEALEHLDNLPNRDWYEIIVNDFK